MHTLDSLAGLTRRELDAVFEGGTLPMPAELRGVGDGRVYWIGRRRAPSGPLAALRNPLLLWRGKVFSDDDAGGVRGLNRIGIGPFERRAFRFTAEIRPSELTTGEVLYIDHDKPGNPASVRAYHDEARWVADDLLLAQSHRRVDGELRFICCFGIRIARTPA